MIKDEVELMLARLHIRCTLLEYLLEHCLLSLQREPALELLRQISNELANHDQLTFPKLSPVLSDMASAEVQEELSYLREVINRIAVKFFEKNLPKS